MIPPVVHESMNAFGDMSIADALLSIIAILLGALISTHRRQTRSYEAFIEHVTQQFSIYDRRIEGKMSTKACDGRRNECRLPEAVECCMDVAQRFDNHSHTHIPEESVLYVKVGK
jgi:hypothetical protein